jgi:hypothetical protein
VNRCCRTCGSAPTEVRGRIKSRVVGLGTRAVPTRYCGVPMRCKRGADAQPTRHQRGTGGVLTGTARVPRGCWVLEGLLDRLEVLGAYNGMKGCCRGYSREYSPGTLGALGGVLRDASGPRRALKGHSEGYSKGYSEGYSGVLGGYSVDTRGVLRGLGWLCGVRWGTQESARTRAHANRNLWKREFCL